MAVWDDVIPDVDREQCVDAAGQGHRLRYGDRPAVLVVDMTNAFVYDRFSLGTEKYTMPCLKSIAELLDVARRQDVPVFYSKGIPSGNPAVLGRFKMSPAVARLLSTPEANQIVAELKPREKDLVVEKCRPSAFFGTPLLNYLHFEKIDTLIVTGVTTAGCVRATVIDAFSHDFTIIVPEECVADRADVSHKVGLFDVHMRYADVIPSREVIHYLVTLSSREMQQSDKAVEAQ